LQIFVVKSFLQFELFSVKERIKRIWFFYWIP